MGYSGAVSTRATLSRSTAVGVKLQQIYKERGK